MHRLYMIYDERSTLCRWVRAWARDQPAFVELVFVPSGSREAERRFPGLPKLDANEDMVAVSDEGHVFRGDSAWIICFYALEEYREWSYRLATPGMRPMARKAFKMLSKTRVNVSDWLELTDRDAATVFGRFDDQANGGASASSLQKIHEMMVVGLEPRDESTGR